MRAHLVALLVPAIALATTTAMPPAKEKSSLLGAWEALDLSDDSCVLYRMVLLPGDDGYLVWPDHRDEKKPEAAAFLGRLAKLEFKDSHVRLLFKRLPNQTDLSGSRYDSIEIEGDVRAIEDTEESKRFAQIKGTTTVRNREGDEYPQTRPLRMEKPAGYADRFAHRLAVEARRAEDLIAQEMKPGPQGSRDDAFAVLRESEVLNDDKRVVSAEWSENSREWRVELTRYGEGNLLIGVNVPAHEFHFVDDPSK